MTRVLTWAANRALNARRVVDAVNEFRRDEQQSGGDMTDEIADMLTVFRKRGLTVTRDVLDEAERIVLTNHKRTIGRVGVRDRADTKVRAVFSRLKESIEE